MSRGNYACVIYRGYLRRRRERKKIFLPRNDVSWASRIGHDSKSKRAETEYIGGDEPSLGDLELKGKKICFFPSPFLGVNVCLA